MADLEGFEEQYPLNSRLVKRDGRLVEEVYRVGGRYDDADPRASSATCRRPSPSRPRAMAEALEALIRYYETGDDADREAYDIAWVERQGLAGRHDQRLHRGLHGRRAASRARGKALVFYVNQEKTAEIQKLAADAQWFEDRMPWDPQYRKADVQGITANAIDVVIETGDSGPSRRSASTCRTTRRSASEYGSKSVSLSNVIEAYDKSTPKAFRAEFSWSPEEAARAEKWSAFASELTTNMHEVIGHASGRRCAERLKGNPQDALKEQFSALEEARADLVALYFLADPKLAELGLVPAADQAEIVRAEYEGYARNALVQLRRVREGTQIEEDHMRNRQMIVRWLMANTTAIESRTRDGKTYYVVDRRRGVPRRRRRACWPRCSGSRPRATTRRPKTLFESLRRSTSIPTLRDEVVARVERLDLPSYTGFVHAGLEPGVRRRRPDHRRRDFVSAGSDGADARAVGGRPAALSPLGATTDRSAGPRHAAGARRTGEAGFD